MREMLATIATLATNTSERRYGCSNAAPAAATHDVRGDPLARTHARTHALTFSVWIVIVRVVVLSGWW
jgi:hypothetical protein